jgi:hypothetical protein
VPKKENRTGNNKKAMAKSNQEMKAQIETPTQTMVDMNNEKLTELARDPANLVYRWGDREALPENEILSLDVVRDKVNRLFVIYTELRMRFINKRICIKQKQWNYIKKVIEKDPEWQSFSYTHSLIFDRVIHPETTEKEIKALMYMIFLKAQEKTGDVINGQEVLKQYLWDQFSMTPGEWEKVIERDGINQ